MTEVPLRIEPNGGLMTEPAALNAEEITLTFTPRQAEFVRVLGRYLRKQDGWWDDEEWWDTNGEVWDMFQALPREENR